MKGLRTVLYASRHCASGAFVVIRSTLGYMTQPNRP